MADKPKKWVAALLGVFSQPIGMLYVARPDLALVYFLLVVVAGILEFVYLRRIAALAVLSFVIPLVCAVHAYRLAARYPDNLPRPWYSRWYGLLMVVVVLSTLAIALGSFVIEPFRFPSGSMIPTIEPGFRLIAQKWGYGSYGMFGINLLRQPISSTLGRGDIIVFEYPADHSVRYAKRLIGLPGDKVAYRNKRLFVNDIEVPTRKVGDYRNPINQSQMLQFVESLYGLEYPVVLESLQSPTPPVTRNFPSRDKCTYYTDGVTCDVPPGHYFVMGDNRDNSSDSRFWGFVPADHITGKVIYILP